MPFINYLLLARPFMNATLNPTTYYQAIIIIPILKNKNIEAQDWVDSANTELELSSV